MNTSDIIAIIAVILSSIVSITSLLISYFNNKDTISIKRQEIFFEKKIQAASEVVEKVEKVQDSILTYLSYQANNQQYDFQALHQQITNDLNGLKQSYARNKILLNLTTSADLFSILLRGFLYYDELLKKGDSRKLLIWAQTTNNELENIVSNMRKDIGLE